MIAAHKIHTSDFVLSETDYLTRNNKLNNTGIFSFPTSGDSGNRTHRKCWIIEESPLGNNFLFFRIHVA